MPATLDQTGGAPPINVVLGADSLTKRRSGVGRMTQEIAHALRGRPDIAGLRLLVRNRLVNGVPDDPDDAPAAMGGQLAGRLRALLAPMPGLQRLRLARAALLLRTDMRRFRAASPGSVVYHEPNMIPAPFRGTTVVTVNDLSWHHHPEMHPADRIAWIGRNLDRTLAQAVRFVAISRFTARGLAAEFGIPRDRIDVVPLAAEARFVPVQAAAAAPVLARHGLADRGYVLSVSTLEPRKNFDRLLAAHRGLPAPLRRRCPLAIVGGSGWGAVLGGGDARAAVTEGSLKLLGHVPDAELVPLYARAAAFAYVSLYEGFGLPLIEAMAAGAPVVASSTTAVGETAGDAARLVDPMDAAAIRAGLQEVLEDGDLAAELRTRGGRHAEGYTWQRTADHLVASWRRALAQPAAA